MRHRPLHCTRQPPHRQHAAQSTVCTTEFKRCVVLGVSPLGVSPLMPLRWGLSVAHRPNAADSLLRASVPGDAFGRPLPNYVGHTGC